jgi:hypothetical protein
MENYFCQPQELNTSSVKMVVMDSVVMGPTHCAYDHCTQDLQNACGGVFCGFHEILHGNRCHMRIQRCHPVKHVHFIMSAGTHMLHDMGSNHYLEFADW